MPRLRDAVSLGHDRAQDRELVAKAGMILSGLSLQSTRELARPLSYDFFDLCEYAGKELMGENPKDHLACERSLQVRLPGPSFEAGYFRAALVPKEKGHLSLSETASFPVGPEIAHDPGYHTSSRRPGHAEPSSQFRQR
jgi:hypothetical protein